MEGYDVAQICLNGHVVNQFAKSDRDRNTKFCKKCGATTLTACPSCGTNIRGYYHIKGLLDCAGLKTPPFCFECGQPYPWTAAKMEASKLLLDEMGLDIPEATILEGDLQEILRDTPKASASAVRVSRHLEKAKPFIAEGFKTLLVEVVSQSAKKILGW